MPIENEGQAIDALVGAAETDLGGGAPEPAEAPAQPGPEGVTEADSFTGIDPNTLSPELQQIYKQMQGDYTRKTQEIAGYRSLGELSEIQQALNFVQGLQSDPNFAAQVYQQLGGLLEQAGHLPGATLQPQAPEEPDYEDYESEIPAPFQNKVQELEQRLAQFEMERRQAQLEAHLDRQEAVIRQSNPNYTQEDIDAITQLAFSTGGDLMRAEQAYKALQQRWASAYMQQKASVPSGLNQPGGGQQAQQPGRFERLDDPQLDKAALNMLLNGEGY